MVIKVITNKTKAKQQQLSLAEAHYLWGVLHAQYFTQQHLGFWTNFTHDMDLNYILKFYNRNLEKDINVVEKLMNTYVIKAPDRNDYSINVAISSEIIRDEFIARNVLLFIQEIMEVLVQAVTASISNDLIRSNLIQISNKSIDNTDKIFSYLNTKGWSKQSPLYPRLPPEVKTICSGEAYFLWRYLTLRYDHIKQTQLFYAFANDGDFKVLLKTGLETILKNQAQLLEKELKHFGIPLPTIPADVVATPENTEMLEDDYMFKNLFNGIQNAIISHAQIMKQCATNSNVRNIFKDMLIEELKVFDSLVKFGNTKGWLNPVPMYE